MEVFFRYMIIFLPILNLTNTKHDATQKETYFDLAAPPIKSWAGSIPDSKHDFNIFSLIFAFLLRWHEVLLLFNSIDDI